MSMARHEFIGRLTKDPESKTLEMNGEQVVVTNFTVAVDEDGKSEQTDFYDVVAWRRLGEVVRDYAGKGRLVYVEGRMKRRSWDKDVNGTPVKMYSWETRANKVQFLDRGDQGGAQQGQQQGGQQYQQGTHSGVSGYGQQQQQPQGNGTAPF